MAQPIVAMGFNVARFDGYNLALRLRHAGYTNVYWYRGGREAWEVAGMPTGNFLKCTVADVEQPLSPKPAATFGGRSVPFWGAAQLGANTVQKVVDLLLDHLVNQGAQRVLLRLELHSNIEIERTFLLGDPLRSAFARDDDADLATQKKIGAAIQLQAFQNVP